MKTSSRIAFHFALFTAVSTLAILLFINVAFFFSWHRLSRGYLENVALQQNRIQAITNALKKTNRRFIVPQDIQMQLPPVGPDRQGEIINEDGDMVHYSRKVVDIINANDGRWYMVYTDDKGKILLDITENINRQEDLALVSIVVLLIIGLSSYWISQVLVSRGLKDLFKLAHGVKKSHIENLDSRLTMDHLPQNDEINIVAGAIDDMKLKISKQIASIKDFVAHVSHEFKTPLMVMRSDIDLANKTKEYDELIEKNMQTVKQMQTLLDGLLVLTTAQTGKLEMTEVNMSTMVQRVCEMMEKKYIDKDVFVHKHISEHVFIDTHQGAAESIISNIVDNAYKYTPEGGKIDLTLTAEGCTIADTGIGIPGEIRENIRQPFWQADKSRQDGVGLGLAIVQKLSDVLGWTVKIDDNESTGTKVIFTFPSDL